MYIYIIYIYNIYIYNIYIYIVYIYIYVPLFSYSTINRKSNEDAVYLQRCCVLCIVIPPIHELLPDILEEETRGEPRRHWSISP